MTRRSDRVNVEWQTPDGSDTGNKFEWHHVRLEVLMDIRSELQRIRQLLECNNIQRMFRTIERLDRRAAQIPTTKLRRKKRVDG